MPGILPPVQSIAPPALPPAQPRSYDLSKPQGLISPGNLDPWHRRKLNNGNGSYSTTLSFSVGTDKGETLIPQVVAGKLLTKREAIAHFNKTGQHLGVFASPEAADAYAQALHNAQAQFVAAQATGNSTRTTGALPPAIPGSDAVQPEKPYVPAPKLPRGPIPKAMLDQMRAKP
jgi:hypothetical protein